MNKYKDVDDLESLFQMLTPERLRRVFLWRESLELGSEILGENFRSEREAIDALHTYYNQPEEPKECNCPPANGTRWMVSPVLIHYVAAGEQFSYLPLIQQAVNEVMTACGISIEFTRDVNAAHIVIRNDALDGRGGTLGQAYLPVSGDDMAACGPMCGDITIDTAENWTTTYFKTVFLHELLHALGISHNTDRRSIMYFQYQGPRGLHAIDIAELVRRYPRRTFT